LDAPRLDPVGAGRCASADPYGLPRFGSRETWPRLAAAHFAPLVAALLAWRSPSGPPPRCGSGARATPPTTVAPLGGALRAAWKYLLF
jgi:hypothetical protein